MRIEVGYGLEGAVPDAATARIIREYIAPKFRVKVTTTAASIDARRCVDPADQRRAVARRRWKARRVNARGGGLHNGLLIGRVRRVVPAQHARPRAGVGAHAARGRGGRRPGCGCCCSLGAGILGALIGGVLMLLPGGAGRSIGGGGWGGFGGGGGGGGSAVAASVVVAAAASAAVVAVLVAAARRGAGDDDACNGCVRIFSVAGSSCAGAFRPALLDAMAAAIAAGERTHLGEVRFALESRLALPAVLEAWTRRHAREQVFAQLARVGYRAQQRRAVLCAAGRASHRDRRRPRYRRAGAVSAMGCDLRPHARVLRPGPMARRQPARASPRRMRCCWRISPATARPIPDELPDRPVLL